MTARLLLAVLLGGLVGLEREQNNHAAGLRTHILVCLGAALIMLLSMYGFNEFVDEYNVRMDPARLAANVITGIGFLGAGTIVFNGSSISGLTTAASLWVVAAIGLAVGAGFYYPALISCVSVLLVLYILNKVEKRYLRGRKRTHVVHIDMPDRPGALAAVSAVLARRAVDIRKVVIEEKRRAGDQEQIAIHLSVRLPRNDVLLPVTDELRQVEGVLGVTIE
ncbi:MgtC/SapB family protein [Paenibacillus koleovorans]|uniref:MgtC/SapB family protein n=1 Tax=Paenibacillus koleovorans TaxID=121608 RepID=UPI000FDC6610|nr:MgtC/SapB family protein [Paenibacillus koleovorans]